MTDQALCLRIIVKTEAPVIRQCLASVRPLITHWLVVDTGSTDNTPALVREALVDLPGELVTRPWVIGAGLTINDRTCPSGRAA